MNFITTALAKHKVGHTLENIFLTDKLSITFFNLLLLINWIIL
jgi:hypothetical protein